MAKSIAEQSNALSIFWLKKHEFLDKDYSLRSGNIQWTYGISEHKNSIDFSVIRDNWGAPEEETYIELRYTHTDHWSGEKESLNYRIKLTTTPCNYGGKRYWFICPLTKSGQYCGRRVGVLYNVGKYFGCRHCGEIAYYAQMQGGKLRSSVSMPDIEKAEKEVKRTYYNGKMTRKYKRLIRLEEKFYKGILRLGESLNLKP